MPSMNESPFQVRNAIVGDYENKMCFAARSEWLLMPVQVTRFVRKMRGGAQAHLLECDDGHFYVAKFRNNPQHRRILVNEWVATVFLNYLQISTPVTAIVNVTADFIAANAEVHIQLGSRYEAIEAGCHFGSRYPGDPAKVLVYDFVPDPLLDKVVNRNEFLGVLAFDKWIGNGDARQSIFFRTPLQKVLRSARDVRQKQGFVAQMIDNGYVFNGPCWTFMDSPLNGLYFRPSVYTNVRSFEDFEPWLGRVVHFPDEIIDYVLKQIPPEWVEGDEAALETMLTKLMSRRNRVPELIHACQRGRCNPFPDWCRLRH
jgi:hypothetical protein